MRQESPTQRAELAGAEETNCEQQVALFINTPLRISGFVLYLILPQALCFYS